jgi:RND superfamily putative drug exporter
MRVNPESIARASSRHPWRTILIWLVVLVTAGIVSGRLMGDALTSDVEFTHDPEAVQADELLSSRLFAGPQTDTETQLLIVQSEAFTVGDAEFQTYVQELQAAVTALGPDVVEPPVVSFYDMEDPDAAQGLVSDDGKAMLLQIETPDDDDTVDALRQVIGTNRSAGFTVQLASGSAIDADITRIVEEDLQRGELIGVVVALIVLVIVFAALIAAVTPVVMAVFAILLALGLVALIGQLFHFHLFVTNMVSMIGLAVGIDYSLFIVSRYREERRKGFDKLEAIGATGATANRAVFFSGLTVVLALLGMLIIPTTIFRALAGGAILVVIAALLASMTLLPALLGLLGDRINWPRLSRRARNAMGAAPRGGFWDRVTGGVMRHPVVSLVAGAVFLLAAGSFYLGIHTGFAGVSTLPDDVQSKRAFEVLQREFAGGQTMPALIVVDGPIDAPEVRTGIDQLREALSADPAFAGESTMEVNDSRDLALVSALLAGDPQSEASVEGIRRLRDQIVPDAFGDTSARVLVGGETAFNTDFFDLAGRYQPIVFAFVLGLSFLLLTVVFRSIVVPVKAIIMNLLSVFAAYGLIVMVFQKNGPAFGRWVADLLGFEQVDTVEAWLPLFLFSVLFGLSMDYHVFLLTRIREHFDRTGDNSEAVAYGLRTTAGIITGAALIMVAVFAGFASGRIVPLQQMGFGLAVAVFFDATVVRSVLVPASMKLLGDRNWYLPKWLQWLPQLKVEGEEPELMLLEAEEELLEPAGR